MSLLDILSNLGKSTASNPDVAQATSFSLASLLSGDGLAKLETDAKAFIVNAEKIVGDVLASNGNVLEMVISLARDIPVVLAEIAEVKQLLVDVKAITSGTHAAVTSAPLPSPSLLPPVLTPGAVSVAHALSTVTTTVPAPANPPSFLDVADHVLQAATKALDPFTPKPLTAPTISNEPHGGA